MRLGDKRGQTIPGERILLIGPNTTFADFLHELVHFKQVRKFGFTDFPPRKINKILEYAAYNYEEKNFDRFGYTEVERELVLRQLKKLDQETIYYRYLPKYSRYLE